MYHVSDNSVLCEDCQLPVESGTGDAFSIVCSSSSSSSSSSPYWLRSNLFEPTGHGLGGDALLGYRINNLFLREDPVSDDQQTAWTRQPTPQAGTPKLLSRSCLCPCFLVKHPTECRLIDRTPHMRFNPCCGGIWGVPQSDQPARHDVGARSNTCAVPPRTSAALMR